MVSQIGMIGIGVMGRNLVLNLLDHNFTVSAHDIHTSQLELLQEEADNDNLNIFTSLPAFISSLTAPRKIMLMVKAGDVTDSVIEELIQHLDDDDIIIDGGNQNFRESQKRIRYLNDHGLRYIGAGISGGAKGARHGPSIMPGGDYTAWKEVKTFLQSIAATSPSGLPCCQWIGPDGAGHYVKTIHNGIEYSDMELIAEIYHLLFSSGRTYQELADIFSSWNDGKLESYLIEITANIFATSDKGTDRPLIEMILDSAGQKGTGKWSVHSALDLGQPSTLIASAVFQRFLSSFKIKRQNFAEIHEKPHSKVPDNLVVKAENALYMSKLLTYIQGFSLLSTASQKYQWDLDLGEIALVWSNGCIIRSTILTEIEKLYFTDKNTDLLFSDYLSLQLQTYHNDLRDVIRYCVDNAIPAPGLMSALSYFDGLQTPVLPANLIQAQRDYFGSHGFKRLDDPNEITYHGNWTA